MISVWIGQWSCSDTLYFIWEIQSLKPHLYYTLFISVLCSLMNFRNTCKNITHMYQNFLSYFSWTKDSWTGILVACLNEYILNATSHHMFKYCINIRNLKSDISLRESDLWGNCSLFHIQKNILGRQIRSGENQIYFRYYLSIFPEI